jgi:RNA ligase (TIGR02306 family)
MRKLVTIRKIHDIKPIKDADNIEVALIDGWEVVVKKNEFKSGDLVLYFEIDSFLPIIPEFEFLRNGSYKKMADDTEGFRIRTRTIRGQISQGLVMPLSLLENKINLNINDENIKNIDFSDILNVIKYEPPIPAELNGEVVGPKPSYFPTTDEERIQNLTDFYEEYKQYSYFGSEKCDGTSGTFYLNVYHFGVCGRKWEYLYSETNTYWKMVSQYDIEKKLRNLDRNIAIQGEIVGEGIQDNKYKLKGQRFYVFNIFDIDKHKYLSKYEMTILCSQLNLETVPTLHITYILPNDMTELINHADGMSKINPNVLREGIVWVSNNAPKRISFKTISNKFLNKHNE